MGDEKWIYVSELPLEEGYYRVRFDDGTEDEKPFRIRPSKSINGFMTEKKVVAWREILSEDMTGAQYNSELID